MIVNIEKRHVFLLVGGLVFFGGLFFVNAFGTSDPATLGHSSAEIVVDDAFCNRITGHGCGSDTNTNAITQCPNDEFLDGDGSCLTAEEIVGVAGGGSGDDVIWFGNQGKFLKEGARTEVVSDDMLYYVIFFGQVKIEDGVVKSRARAQSKDGASGNCDSGWVVGYISSCTVMYGGSSTSFTAHIKATSSGVLVWGEKVASGEVSLSEEVVGAWLDD